MSDPNAVSWSEHRTFHATFDGLTLTVMQPIFGSGAQFFWEVSGFGQSNKGHGSSLLEAKRDCEAAARAMAKGMVKK